MFERWWNGERSMRDDSAGDEKRGVSIGNKDDLNDGTILSHANPNPL